MSTAAGKVEIRIVCMCEHEAKKDPAGGDIRGDERPTRYLAIGI